MSTPPLPPQPPYTPVPPPPVSTAPPPGNAAGGSAVKIILIVVAAFVCIGILGASIFGYIVYRAAHAVNVDKNGGVSITTPGGTYSTSGSGSASIVSTADLGTDLYPGAVKGEGSMNLKTPQGTMVTAIYTTSDPAPQVVEFYKSKLGENASTVETGNGTMLTSADNNDHNSLLVTVTADEGKTKITIVHTTKKE